MTCVYVPKSFKRFIVEQQNQIKFPSQFLPASINFVFIYKCLWNFATFVKVKKEQQKTKNKYLNYPYHRPIPVVVYKSL